jgi:DNA primase
MSGRIPQSFIDDVLARVDIVDVIETFIPLRKVGRNYVARCPFHNEKTPSFSVNREKQFFHCFGCGATGSAIGFLIDHGKLDFVSAVQDLANRAGLPMPTAAATHASSAPVVGPLYDILNKAAKFYCDELRKNPDRERAVSYLKQRGVSGIMAKEFSLGYAPPGWRNLLTAFGDSKEGRENLKLAGLVLDNQSGDGYDRFRDRVMFPILDSRGRVVGFGGRVIDGGEPKYLNSPETPVFHKGSEIYGLYQARKACKDLSRIVVVEGYMDVLALAQHEVRNAVATLGTATTPDHLKSLFRVVPELVFCFDGDNAGRKAAWHALEIALPFLVEGRQANFMFLPPGDDPDTYVRKAGPASFNDPSQWTSLTEFLLSTLVGKVNLSSLDGRARFAELANPYAAAVPPGALKRLLLKRIAEISGLENDRPAATTPRKSQSASGRAGQQGQKDLAIRTLVHRAIACLITEPSVASTADKTDGLDKLKEPDLPLLLDLIEVVHHNPSTNSGAMLERCRKFYQDEGVSHRFTHPANLAADEIKEEFTSIINKLRGMLASMERRETLLNRFSPSNNPHKLAPEVGTGTADPLASKAER